MLGVIKRLQINKIIFNVIIYMEFGVGSLCFENKGFQLFYKLFNLLFKLFKEFFDCYVCVNIEKKFYFFNKGGIFFFVFIIVFLVGFIQFFLLGVVLFFILVYILFWFNFRNYRDVQIKKKNLFVIFGNKLEISFIIQCMLGVVGKL